MACIQVPSPSTATFINPELAKRATFETTVSIQLLTAGQIERQLAIAQGNYHNGVSAITVVVDVSRIRGVISTLTLPTLVLE